MAEITVPSGATVEIGEAGFQETMKLKSAIHKEASRAGMKFDLDLKKDVDFGSIINAFLSVDSSEEVQKLLWPCLARSKYNSEKITPATFENIEARQDYYPIVIECIKVNIGPFYPGLISAFKGFMERAATTSLAPK